jgi:MFS family permease
MKVEASGSVSSAASVALPSSAVVTEGRTAWRMVAIGFISQGAAYGMTFGLAGTFVGPAEYEFHASRAASSLGVSVVALLHGLLGPVVGRWLALGSVRAVMVLGAILMAAAYLSMYFAPNVWTFSLGFGLFGGAAVACLGVTPVTALVGRWFPRNSGRALGLANMPILVTLLPLVGGFITLNYGWRVTALCVAGAAVALIPLFRLVRDPAAASAFLVPRAATEPAEVRFRPDLQFWMLVIGVGVLDGTAITLITHVVPYATEIGIPYRQATLLVSVLGLFGLAGAPLLGLLADRIGGAFTLAVVALLLLLGWFGYTLQPPFLAVAGITGLLGFCGGAFAGLLGATLSLRYPGPSLGPAVGLAVMVALPFNFVLPLLAGYVHDRTHSYQWTFFYHLGLLAFALAMFLAVARAYPGAPGESHDRLSG